MSDSINSKQPSLETLRPEAILSAGEAYLDRVLNGVITPYNSYINRVYGVQDEEGNPYIMKFYRPGRWTESCILEEHAFLKECLQAEVPVIPPLPARDTSTLLKTKSGIYYTIFPLRGGRTFDITCEEDWVRLGAIVGRMHRTGKEKPAQHRVVCSPKLTTTQQMHQLTQSGLVPRDLISEFTALCEETLEIIIPQFEGTDFIRIHGDCHRGNILDRMDKGLLIIDFDDMMMGPPVQDLWLLLPGHLDECSGEVNLLIRGYTQFMEFDKRTLSLIEPLRFMRIIYFLSWCAMQKNDLGFLTHFPAWGEEGFWNQELEDIAYQKKIILEHMS